MQPRSPMNFYRFYAETPSPIIIFSMAKRGADQCYRDSGLKPTDVDVLEVHDCFSCNELLMYEALGLTDDAVQ